jgi:predicted negative regulator of RcsB-dependent stress response
MNLKAILIGTILIIAIIFAFSRLMDSVKEKQKDATNVLEETVGLKRKARGLVDKSKEQIEQREKLVEDY